MSRGNRAWASRRAILLAGLSLAGAVVFFVSTRFRVLASPATIPQGELYALQAFPLDDWRGVLQAFVDDEGRVDYEALLADRGDLDRFVALLRDVGPRTRPELFPSEADRLAYYLNAYNALVLFDVLDHWPLESPRDVRLRFFYTTRFLVDGAKTNLYELENHVIRRLFDEPRIHFALNCASLGCPKLPREPFEAARLEEQLARETHRFLSEPRNVTVEDGAIVVSELFDWFDEDFPPSPLDWLRAHPSLSALQKVPVDAPLRTRPWDWAINAMP